MTPIRSLFTWILGKIGSVILVFAVLWAGAMIFEKFQEIKQRGQFIIQLQSIDGLVKDSAEEQSTDAKARIKKLDLGARDGIQRRLQDLKSDIDQLRDKLPSPKERALAIAKGDTKTISDWAITETTILLRQEESDVLGRILEYRTKLDEYQRWMHEGPTELERLRLEHVATLDQIEKWGEKIDQIEKDHPVLVRVPGSQLNKEWKQLSGLRTDRAKHTHQLQAKHDELTQFLRMLERPEHPGTLLHIPKIEHILEDIRIASGDLEAKLKQDWFWRLVNQDFSTTDLVKSAVIIVVVATLTPFGIRLVLFYILAPVATRRPPLALLPKNGGQVLAGRDLTGQMSEPASSVSCRVMIDASNELLVHAEYLQSQPTGCETRTQWILNHHIPLSSIAAGLFQLTQIRAESPQTVVVSSMNDPLSEISLLTIPSGSSAVLLPRHIVGVLQPRGKRLHITRHWQLFSLHAWLTLKLRHLAFHGPVTLVVKGCRGVRVEAVETGRSLNPSVNIGFSTNLHYASRRCETFNAYLRGKQPLLNDSFSGDGGYYIYQEMPHQRRGGFFGRGLEGVLDGVLKTLGL